MSIYDFVELLTDDSQMVSVWDGTKEEEAFCGEARELLYEDIRECEVWAVEVDPLTKWGVLLVLTIETEEEEDE